MLMATMCSFKRERNSPDEYGIALMSNSGCEGILPLNGKPIATDGPWTFDCLWSAGCFTVPSQYEGQ